METATLNALWSKILGIFPSKTLVATALSYKQDKIDSSHKLSADLLEDGTTNKIINVKPNWNAESGSDAEILNKPTIPSAPGTLNTNNSTSQSTNSSEALSGTVKLHKVSKTGNYNDLLNRPSIPDTETLLKKPNIQDGYTMSGYNGYYANIANSYTTEYYVYRFSDINACTFQLDPPSYSDSAINKGAMFIIFLGTGSSPDISFSASSNGYTSSPHSTTNNIYYGGSFKSFEANKYYMIYGEWNGYSWILTQYELYTTPTVEYSIGGASLLGAYWRSYHNDNSGNDEEILVNSEGKILKFYRQDSGSSPSYYYLINSPYGINPDNMAANGSFPSSVLSSFGGDVECPWTVSESSSGNMYYTDYTFTVDGISYTLSSVYNNSTYENSQTISPTVTDYDTALASGGGNSGLYWRTSVESQYNSLLVDAAGKILNLGDGDTQNFYVYRDDTHDSIRVDSMISMFSSSKSSFGETICNPSISGGGSYKTYTFSNGGTLYEVYYDYNLGEATITPSVTQNYS